MLWERAFSRPAMTNEKRGGHGDRATAVAALELAIWDLNAKLSDEPASVTIARAAGRPAQTKTNPVYAAAGHYYPEDSSNRLRSELQAYRDLGFVDFKIKIGGASLEEDLKRIHVALEISDGGEHLAVDANGRFDLQTALTYPHSIPPLP